MRVPAKLGSIIILCLFLVLGRAPAAAQTTSAGSELSEPFMEVVDVEIINIDTWVTDRNGDPVGGLEKDDFLVYRDGQPVEVTNFYAVSSGRPTLSSRTGAEKLDDPVRAPIPKLPVREVTIAPEHRLWLIAYIDNYNIHPTERNRILPDLERFLRRSIEAGAQVMVVSYNRSLDVRQPFTDRLSEITIVLAEIKDDIGQAVIRRRDQADTLRQIDDAESPDQARLIARLYADEQMNGVNYTVEALGRLIDTLGGLPGRKALIHVSSGIPMLAGEEMFHSVAEKFGVSEPYSDIPRYDTTRKFESLDRRANAHRVSFYTLDAGGLRGFQFGAAEYGGFVNTRLRSVLDSVVPENLQAPLRLMAHETGGRAILNRNQVLPALEEVADDFRFFYSLGILSIDTDSGRYHEIEVKLRDRPKGTRVRHRSGYRSKSTRTRVRESLRSALLYAHQDNPLGMEVLWGRAEPQGEKGRYLLPIRLSIPLVDVTLVPVRTGQHEARLELFVAVVGMDGRTSDIDDVPFGVRLSDEHVEAARAESLVHTHKLLLSRGRQKVGVAVLDVFGSQSSVVTGIVQVGPPDEPDSEAGNF
ncbi:MAG: VWA domain-containing protein [Acidobacteria bacterium]|nr:VWA domain-containing protein [Acidobacteriota bacterium]